MAEVRTSLSTRSRIALHPRLGICPTLETNAGARILVQKSLQVDPGTSAGYQVRRCHRKFDRLLTSYLSRHGLKTGFWYYLRILWIKDGVSQKYLSDMTNVAENTTASILNSMAQEGLITRERNEHDKRKFDVCLTDKGRALESELMGYAAKINRVASQGIEQAEIDQCLAVLEKMSSNLAEAFDEQ